ncbi:MAG: hypothetical protein HWN66_20250 [Candidatus Helarchaeota archaeon]|nr:hypothetical protein [Candidatus Helarchaeota archaeon]
MPKDKNYKKMVKGAFEDKANNIVFIMKFLDSKGGLNLVKEYFAEAVPNYILEFIGFGGAKKWIMRQWLKASPHGYLQKIGEEVKSDADFLKQNFELIEDAKTRIVSKIDCKYMRKLVKTGKKFGCEFDVREYYCQNACIPLLSKVLSDIYLRLNVELTQDGCIQIIEVDKSSFQKDEEEAQEKEKKSD